MSTYVRYPNYEVTCALENDGSGGGSSGGAQSVLLTWDLPKTYTDGDPLDPNDIGGY
ncbi:hypothetical protein MNBD_NITROSPINAE01-1098 [hydrothermal vent metagenome]|uniref:Uncharacterized protein n=1 Tax=hydrothermal vent metagenome TaxID=652676 RepID=A0A3B1CNL5_9ZZZZ